MTFKTAVTGTSMIQGLTDFQRLAHVDFKHLKQMEFSLPTVRPVVLGDYESFNNTHVFSSFVNHIYKTIRFKKKNPIWNQGRISKNVHLFLPACYFLVEADIQRERSYWPIRKSGLQIGPVWTTYPSSTSFWKLQWSYFCLFFHISSCPSIPTALRHLFALGRINVNSIFHLILCTFCFDGYKAQLDSSSID